MSTDHEFMRAARALPTPLLSLIRKGVTRMETSPTADGVVQNHAYLQGIINAAVTLGVMPHTAAKVFCAGAIGLCCERLATLSVESQVVNATRHAGGAASRVH